MVDGGPFASAALGEAVARQRAEVRRTKAQLREAREAVKVAAGRLNEFERQCAAIGIGFTR